MINRWVAIVAIICITIVGSIYIFTELDRKYIESGYTRGTLQGAYGHHWVKP